MQLALKLEFYLLQEYDTNQAHWEAGTEDVRIGDCHFSSRVVNGKRCLNVSLDCPLPGTSDRLTGTITGEALSTKIATPDSHEAGHHEWTPLLGPGTLQAELRVGSQAHFSFSGRGYHDRNGGNKALHNLGIYQVVKQDSSAAAEAAEVMDLIPQAQLVVEAKVAVVMVIMVVLTLQHQMVLLHLHMLGLMDRLLKT